VGTSPYYADDWLTVLHGDVRDKLRELPDESVHCVVTSPPYWGLRDYGTATWEGGDETCDHKPERQKRNDRPLGAFHGGSDEGNGSREPTYKDTCHDCGATRIDSQLGLEPTPEQYVENMVAVFREVRRVLRSDGTVWLNLGDSYAVNGGARDYGSTDGAVGRGDAPGGPRRAPSTLKPKDLVGIPWRVAFALQADGWYLRSDIIWSKPNPMPESVTDRPTKSHEYLFLLAKSARYYFDADAVREGVSENTHSRGSGIGPKNAGIAFGQGIKNNEDFAAAINGPVSARNIRSVWTVATQPYPGAHFATFPPKLIEPCIKAGCPEGGTVLDPFAGSGTTGMVAQSLSRRAILIDLNVDYLGQLMDRNRDIPLGLDVA
jgi:DNA modification methylase